MKKSFFDWSSIKRMQGNDYSIGENENQYNNSEPEKRKNNNNDNFIFIPNFYV